MVTFIFLFSSPPTLNKFPFHFMSFILLCPLLGLKGAACKGMGVKLFPGAEYSPVTTSSKTSDYNTPFPLEALECIYLPRLG